MGSPAKHLRARQKFIVDNTNLWPVLKSSKGGEYYAFCDVCNFCNTDFTISHGGKHVSTKKHVELEKLKTENKSVWAQSGSLDWAVTCGKYVAFMKMSSDS